MATDIDMNKLATEMRERMLMGRPFDDDPLAYCNPIEVLAILDEREKLRALLVDIDKSGLLGHGLKCHIYNGLPCTCDHKALQRRINEATKEDA